LEAKGVHIKNKAIILGTLLLFSCFFTITLNLTRGQQASLFRITLLVPPTNPARQHWSQLIQDNLNAVGIDAKLVITDWETIYDRVLDPPPDIRGITFDEGGFDMVFVGFNMDIDPDPYSLYHSSQVPPGQNYYNWENTENDELCELIRVTIDETQRIEYVKQWQHLAFDELPSITLHYDKEVVCYDPRALVGDPFEILHYPIWPRVEKWDLNKTKGYKACSSRTNPSTGI
jgi:ABC-type transport system substrate-binding protein